jgi:hypothetical protein
MDHGHFWERYMKRITQTDIDQLAQRHGFADFRELNDHVEACSDRESLAIDLLRLEGQIKGLITSQQASLPPRNGLADVEVDDTGLPHLNDLVLTVSRLIVKLLFGYEAEEIQFLRDRALDIEAKHIHEAHHRNRMLSSLGGLNHG